MDGDFEAGAILMFVVMLLAWIFLPVDCSVTAHEIDVATNQCSTHGGVVTLYRHNYLNKNSVVECEDGVQIVFNAHEGGL